MDFSARQTPSRQLNLEALQGLTSRVGGRIFYGCKAGALAATFRGCVWLRDKVSNIAAELLFAPIYNYSLVERGVFFGKELLW
jgi:hypothetical protein